MDAVKEDFLTSKQRQLVGNGSVGNLVHVLWCGWRTLKGNNPKKSKFGMPSTIEKPKKESVSREEKPNIVGSSLAVNGLPNKNRVSAPVVQNGEHAAPDQEAKMKACESANEQLKEVLIEFKDRLKLLRVNDQVRELQTTLRDRETTRSDFIFYADRLIRLVVEEGLNQLPFDECCVTTPTGANYNGLKFRRGICGVSIVRSGEAMEKGLRECCRSIRIGKVLIKTEEESAKPVVCYARFPPDIEQRRVFLMYPLLNSGNTVTTAVDVLIDSGVEEDKIIILTLFATYHGVTHVLGRYKKLILLTTEVYGEVPIQFGRKYFGTD